MSRTKQRGRQSVEPLSNVVCCFGCRLFGSGMWQAWTWDWERLDLRVRSVALLVSLTRRGTQPIVIQSITYVISITVKSLYALD